MTTTTTTTSTSTYTAAAITTPGGPEAIELVQRPVVAPGPGEVLLRVAAAAVNPVDLSVRAGVFHGIGLITHDVVGLGWDVAGTVEAVGSGVAVEVGTRVAALVPGFDRDFGPYAEQLVLPAAHLAVVPDGLDLVSAATVPLNALTAAAVVDLLGAGDGRRLLVTGAAGAVGGYLLRLAAEAGWSVTGLARAQDEEFVVSQGAAFTDAPTTGWDAVADPAGLGADAVALVADGGRYVGVLPAWPAEAERGIDVSTVSVEPDPARLAVLLARTASGDLPVRVAEVLPLRAAAAAHRAVEKGGVRGRYVLVP